MTTGNWDFSNTNWVLDSVHYVSSPSSLREDHHVQWTTDSVLALIKIGIVPIASVKEGKMETQWRQEAGAGQINIVFRYQDDNNYYYVQFSPYNYLSGYGLQAACYKVVAGIQTQLGTTVKTLYTIDSNWTNVRITWWNDAVGLVIRAEYYNGSVWTSLFDYYDTLNLWKTIGGRVGIRVYGYYSYATHYCGNIDDTYIYGV
jgi:hypothetical protein